MNESIFVGQMEVISTCDLVEVFHREPVMHPITHTFTGQFESKSCWTAMTPDKARDLAKALETMANRLDDIQAAKSAQSIG